MSLLTQRIDTWSWRLIFVGVVLGGLGLAVRRNDDTLGGWIAAAGAAGIVVGAVLIWWRSRLRDDNGRPLP